MRHTHRTPASWVIVRLATDEAVFETFNEQTARAINRDRYRAVPIHEYLGQLHQRIAATPSLPPDHG